MDGWPFSRRERESGAAPDYYKEGLKLAGKGKHHEALTSFRLALKERPEDAEIMQQMALVYTHIGLPDEAIRCYEDCLEVTETAPAAHYGLAFLYLHRGDVGNARLHLKAFLREPPADENAAAHVEHALATLRRLSGGASADESVSGSGEGVT
ncbi:MAG: tetratricopeptide repeat protein [Gemmatimonadota bacterium]|nr:MAG: tetratricopeptide repeat protein [Gemmatimonadota bacterium]